MDGKQDAQGRSDDAQGSAVDPNSGSHHQNIDSALACLVLISRFHGVAVDPSQLAHEFLPPGGSFGRTEVLLAAKKLGLKAKSVVTSVDRITALPLPAMAIDDKGGFYVIAKADDQRVLLHDPRETAPGEFNCEVHHG